MMPDAALSAARSEVAKEAATAAHFAYICENPKDALGATNVATAAYSDLDHGDKGDLEESSKQRHVYIEKKSI